MKKNKIETENIWTITLNEKIIFNDIENLLNGIDKIMSSQKQFNEYLDMIYELFKDSEHKNYRLLKETLKL